jgi:hypothetical protein
MTNQRMVLPEPAKNADGGQGQIEEELEKHTFAVDPQERAIGLPFCKHTASKEPLCCSSKVSVACDVLIC